MCKNILSCTCITNCYSLNARESISKQTKGASTHKLLPCIWRLRISNWYLLCRGLSAKWVYKKHWIYRSMQNWYRTRFFKCGFFYHSITVATEWRLSRSTAKHHRLMKIPDFSWVFICFPNKWRNFQGLYFFSSPVFKDPWEPCIKM